MAPDTCSNYTQAYVINIIIVFTSALICSYFVRQGNPKEHSLKFVDSRPLYIHGVSYVLV